MLVNETDERSQLVGYCNGYCIFRSFNWICWKLNVFLWTNGVDSEEQNEFEAIGKHDNRVAFLRKNR